MYGTSAAFITYHENRGREIPGTWDDDVIDAALLVASEWIDGAYGPLFVGSKTGGYLQAREWPRAAAYTNTFPSYTFTDSEIPDAVVNAVYEAAFRQATTPGCLEPDYTPGKYSSVSIDGAVSVEYAANISQSQDLRIQMGAIDRLLYPLLDSKDGRLSPLSGAITR